MGKCFSHDEVFPIIIRIIQQEYERKKRFIQQGEIVRSLRRDPEGQRFIQEAYSKYPSPSQEHACNMVAQFNQYFTQEEFGWNVSLERKKINSRWAYKPIQDPWIHELLNYDSEQDISLLMHPDTPKPLYGMTVRSIKGQNWWDEIRRVISCHHRFRCKVCRVYEFETRLEMHEHYAIDHALGEVILENIFVLCHSCHQFIHGEQLWFKYLAKEISFDEINNIYHHGFALLRLAQLHPYWKTELLYRQLRGDSKEKALQLLNKWGIVHEPEEIAPWQQWHLVVDGQKYYTPYKDINEWKQIFVKAPQERQEKATKVYILKSSGKTQNKEVHTPHIESQQAIQQDISLLTHPNIPKPLHGVNPRTIKGQEWWDEVRQEAYSQNDYHCWACGIHKYHAKYRQWLEAHEYYTIDYTIGRVELIKIVALCHSCHQFIHSERLWYNYRCERIPYEIIDDIYNHGFALLRLARLQPYWKTEFFYRQLHWESEEQALQTLTKWGLVNEPEEVAPWQQWHLVLDGEKYYTPYKDIDEWRQAWSEG